MKKINNLMRELEYEITKLDSNNNDVLIIRSIGKKLQCEYDYNYIGDVSEDEFICLSLDNLQNDTGESMSLTLKDALILNEHIGK